MKKPANEPVTAPGVSLSVKTCMPVPKDTKVNLAVATTLTPFDQVQDLLSSKPLRRPSRNRPLD